MRYPTLSRNDAVDISDGRIAQLRSSVEAAGEATEPFSLSDLSADLRDRCRFSGDGEDLPETDLVAARQEVESGTQSHAPQLKGADKDVVEGRAALVVHQAISHSGAGPEVLDDPGFWRYVAIAYLWNFAVWREYGTVFPKSEDSDETLVSRQRKFAVYIDAQRFHECVPTRMWLRVNVLGGQELDLAHRAEGSTDFWRSHILRVKAGEYPAIVRAMARRQAEASTRLNTGPLREFAKQLDRTVQNLVPALLDDEAADRLVGELWDRQLQ